MGKVYTEKEQRTLSDLLGYEVDFRLCRESATLAPTTIALEIGQVLQESDDGLIPITSEGTPYAVLGRNIPISTEAQEVMILARSVILNKDMLILGTGVKLDTVCEKLRSLHILVR